MAGSIQVGNGSAQSTFYFDDLRFTRTLASEEFKGGSFAVRPNPTANRWTVDGSFGAEWDVRLVPLSLLFRHAGQRFQIPHRRKTEF